MTVRTDFWKKTVLNPLFCQSSRHEPVFDVELTHFNIEDLFLAINKMQHFCLIHVALLTNSHNALLGTVALMDYIFEYKYDSQ